MEKGSVTKSQKGKKSCVESKVRVSQGRHMENVPKESDVVSVMTQYLVETVAQARDAEDDRLLPHVIRRQDRLTARDKNPQRIQVTKRKALQTKGSEISCRFKFCQNPS